MSEFTDMQLVEAISVSLAIGALDRIVPLMTVLAVQNPEMAQQCLDLMKLGTEISRGRQGVA